MAINHSTKDQNTGNTTINSGLRADLMRTQMESKNTLTQKGSLYVGTGTQDANGISLTNELQSGAVGDILQVTNADHSIGYGKITNANFTDSTLGNMEKITTEILEAVEQISVLNNARISFGSYTDIECSATTKMNSGVLEVHYFTGGSSNNVPPIVFDIDDEFGFALGGRADDGVCGLFRPSSNGWSNIVDVHGETVSNVFYPMVINGNNKVTGHLYVTGNIQGGGTITGISDVVSGTYHATSDRRLKENLSEYQPMKSILDLPVYKFDFINGSKNNIGCMAQDLREICPEIVSEGEDGFLTIQENKIVFLLLQEVKKLREEVEALKK